MFYISHSGQINGDMMTSSYSERTYRHDPYVGWYADTTQSCTTMVGGLLRDESKIIENPTSEGEWWEYLGTGEIDKKAEVYLSGFMLSLGECIGGPCQPKRIGAMNVEMELSGSAPDNLNVEFVGGFNKYHAPSGKFKVDSIDGRFRMDWYTGSKKMKIVGQIMGKMFVISEYEARDHLAKFFIEWPGTGEIN